MNDWPKLGIAPDSTYRWTNGPREKNAAIIDRAKQIVASVPYQVPLRFIFYRLWQEGIYSGKTNEDKARAYSNFAGLISTAVHSGYWEPDMLSDERREAMMLGSGYENESAWLRAVKENLCCLLNWRYAQDYIVSVAYEAESMTPQFKHYCNPYSVERWPFVGHPSNPYKHEFAKRISELYWRYNGDVSLHRDGFIEKPIVILYFGDYDKGGLQIPETAFAHIREWSNAPHTVYRVGLNEGDGERMDLPSDPDKPGRYQWAALTDEQAGSMITSALDEFVDKSKLYQTTERESAAEEKVRQALSGLTFQE